MHAIEETTCLGEAGAEVQIETRTDAQEGDEGGVSSDDDEEEGPAAAEA